MGTLYVTRAQPNPPGRDTIAKHLATNQKLNEEWVEFMAVNGERNLAGDEILQLVFNDYCGNPRAEAVIKFSAAVLPAGHSIRLHTGSGVPSQEGTVHHVYLNRSWFVWNNRCGDRVTLRFQDTILDSAAWASNPPEGVLVRVNGTDRLEAGVRRASGW